MAQQSSGSAGGPRDWQDRLVTKNTFLDWPSPWLDADHKSAFEESESGRASSDPTSTSSRCSSVNSASSSSGPRAQHASSVEALEGMVARVRKERLEDAAADATASAPPAKMPMEHIWTPGAEGHEADPPTCTPCINFSNGMCKKGADCIRCHLFHEKKVKEKKKRQRPPPRMRLEQQARLAAEGKLPEKSEARKLQEEKQEEAKQKQLELMLERLEELLGRAHQDGAAFDMDTAEYFPEFVRGNPYLRERFMKAMEVYSQERTPPSMPPPPPPVPEASPCNGAASSSGDTARPSPGVSAAIKRPKETAEDGNASSGSDDTFSL